MGAQLDAAPSSAACKAARPLLPSSKRGGSAAAGGLLAALIMPPLLAAAGGLLAALLRLPLLVEESEGKKASRLTAPRRSVPPQLQQPRGEEGGCAGETVAAAQQEARSPSHIACPPGIRRARGRRRGAVVAQAQEVGNVDAAVGLDDDHGKAGRRPAACRAGEGAMWNHDEKKCWLGYSK